MIRTVVFDIGNVILYFDHEKMVHQLSSTLQVPFSQIKAQLFEEELLVNFEAGQVTTDELFSTLSKSSPTQPKKEDLLKAYNTIFWPNEPLVPILHSLKRQGKKLLLLSNISEAHFDFIYQTYPALQLFDTAILSYKVRHSKPEAEIYHEVLKAADCLPHECFYTDDILGHVRSAKTLGIDAEQFLSTELLIAHLAKRMIFV